MFMKRRAIDVTSSSKFRIITRNVTNLNSDDLQGLLIHEGNRYKFYYNKYQRGVPSTLGKL